MGRLGLSPVRFCEITAISDNITAISDNIIGP
jgi:hypothetical protein